jgi:uncharacterized protein YndB with AHSA1/START domain
MAICSGSVLTAPINAEQYIKLRSAVPSLQCIVWLPRERECVFNSWTIPEYMELWTNADGFSDVQATSELRAGAPFSIVARRHGVVQYRVTGSYCDIEEPDHITCTWSFRSRGKEWDSTVRAEFRDLDGGTLLRILQSDIALNRHREEQSLWWRERFERMREVFTLMPMTGS